MNAGVFYGNVYDLAPVVMAFFAECRCSEFDVEIDLKRVFDELNQLKTGPDSALIVLVNEAGAPCGYMGVLTFTSPIGHERIANEHYWYVKPDCRKLSSLKMLAEAQKWAKGKGCTHFISTASRMASDMHDDVCSLYENLGMKKFETSYIINLKEV